MKFSDLDDFVNNQMMPYSDKSFQQVVIATLIQNGGTATLEELKEQVLKYHPGNNFDINHPSIKIITEAVTRDNKVLYDGKTIAERKGDKIEILNYDEYTIKEQAKLIVDCILKIQEKKEYLEDSIEYGKYMIQHMPELKTQKEEVLKKYRNMFRLENIDKLTQKSYQDFLLYKNNHHWTDLDRDGGNRIKDMPKLKQTLKILVDESIPIEKRIEEIRTQKGLGKATFTPILLVASSLKYAVVNDVVTGFGSGMDDGDGAFAKLGFITPKLKKRLLSKNSSSDWEFILLAQEMVKHVAKIYHFDLWDIDWVWYDVVHKRKLGQPPKYYLITPGTESDRKDEFLEKGFIGIGYMDLFLPRYFYRDVIVPFHKQKFREIVEKKLTKKTTNSINWYQIHFKHFMEMAKGDVIVLWNNSTKIFAIGEVDGRYQYNKKDNLHHHRKVVWKDTQLREIPPDIKSGGGHAITRLKDPKNDSPEEVKPLYKWLFGDTGKTSTMNSADYQEDLALLEWKKNLILYGPPGTGKTFHATQIAKEFTNQSNSNSQIRRPTWRSVTTLVLLENKGKPLNYHEITKRALSKNLIKTHGGTPEETIAKIMREDIDQSGSDSYFAKPSDGIYGLNIPTTIAKAAEIILYAENKPLHYTEIAQKAIDSQIVSFKGLTPEKSLLAEITKDIQTNGANSKFIQISVGTYSLQKKNPVSSITIDDNDKFIKNVTFHQSYSYEEFIEGIKPKVDTDETTKHRYINYEVRDGIFKNFCSRAAEDPENKYVMIIDEINRGNISKVFGELITVIEKDKRGSDHKVTLPYSKESFSVPKNVYVIGTMNTADRSIAKIDTALTRRFGRREIMPDSSVLKNKIVDGINLTELLDKLNNKILEISSRERQIGHSYLMDGDLPIDNISDLRLAFLYDIIPLLKELTFDDDENLRNIIGDHFIDPKTKTIKEDLTKTDEAFLKEMESFLNSNSQKNDPEETGGDVTDEEG